MTMDAHSRMVLIVALDLVYHNTCGHGKRDDK